MRSLWGNTHKYICTRFQALFYISFFLNKASVYTLATINSAFEKSNSFLIRCQWRLEVFLAFVLFSPHKTDVADCSCI